MFLSIHKTDLLYFFRPVQCPLSIIQKPRHWWRWRTWTHQHLWVCGILDKSAQAGPQTGGQREKEVLEARRNKMLQKTRQENRSAKKAASNYRETFSLEKEGRGLRFRLRLRPSLISFRYPISKGTWSWLPERDFWHGFDGRSPSRCRLFVNVLG